MDRFNPFKLADNLIEANYKIPLVGDIEVGVGESFMTTPNRRDVNLGEYLDFLRRYIFKLEEKITLIKKDKTRLDFFDTNKEYILGFAPSGDYSIFRPDGKTCYGPTVRDCIDKAFEMHTNLTTDSIK